MAREGIDAARVHFVGNTMIDTLERLLPRARGGEARERLRLTARAYGLVTLHRPSNVDDVGRLEALLGALRGICAHVPLAWPVHPRTRARLGELHEAGGEQAGGAAAAGPPAPRLLLTEPLGYLDFLQLMDGARLTLTDSVADGANRLVDPCDAAALVGAVDAVLAAPMPAAVRPELWDGHAAERLVAVIAGRAASRRAPEGA